MVNDGEEREKEERGGCPAILYGTAHLEQCVQHARTQSDAVRLWRREAKSEGSRDSEGRRRRREGTGRERERTRLSGRNAKCSPLPLTLLQYCSAMPCSLSLCRDCTSHPWKVELMFRSSKTMAPPLSSLHAPCHAVHAFCVRVCVSHAVPDYAIDCCSSSLSSFLSSCSCSRPSHRASLTLFQCPLLRVCLPSLAFCCDKRFPSQNVQMWSSLSLSLL